MKNRNIAAGLMMMTVCLAVGAGCGTAGGTAQGTETAAENDAAENGEGGGQPDTEGMDLVSALLNGDESSLEGSPEKNAKEDQTGHPEDKGGDNQAGQPAGKDSEDQAGQPEDKDGDASERKPEEAARDTVGENTAGEEESLLGNVKSIGSGSIIVSKAFEEGDDVLVAPADGSEDEVLVSVSLSERTRYEVKTVKNGGVHGEADVETRTGDASDLKENAAVEISGYYDGELFCAEQVTISVFV